MEFYNIGNGFTSSITGQHINYYFIRDYSLKQEYEKEYNVKVPVEFYRDIFTDFVAPVTTDFYFNRLDFQNERINSYVDIPIIYASNGFMKLGDESLSTIYFLKENQQLLNEYKLNLFMQTNKFKNAYEEIQSKLKDLGLSSKEYFEKLYEEYKKLIDSYLSINQEDKNIDNESFKNISIDDIKFYSYDIGGYFGFYEQNVEIQHYYIAYEYDGILRDLITNAKLVPEEASFYPDDALVCNTVEPIEYCEVLKLINSSDDVKDYYIKTIYELSKKEDLLTEETIIRHIRKLNMI